MLQTTKNQLNNEQIALNYRKRIIDQLNNAGYNNIIADKTNTNSQYIVYQQTRKRIIGLDFDEHLDIENGYEIRFEDNYEIFYISIKEIQSKDIDALIKLYLMMLDKRMNQTPEVIKNLNDQILEPGQLAKIISEYLTTEKN